MYEISTKRVQDLSGSETFMEMELLIRSFLGLRRLATVRYPNLSGSNRYIFMWFPWVLGVKIRPIP